LEDFTGKDSLDEV
jgi:hypothetical protein